MREKDQVSCCFFFLPGQQLDGNAWTLPVGIRKSDENRAAVHATQKGGSPRDDGDRPAGVGSRKERKNLGKVSNLPESHSDFSDSLKRRKDNTAPPPQKKKDKKQRHNVKAANSAENRKAGLFSQLQLACNPFSSMFLPIHVLTF